MNNILAPRTCLLTIGLFLSLLSFSRSPSLTIVFSGIKEIPGSSLMVAVYNNKESFLDSEKMFRKVEIPVDSATISCLFEALPEGKYAVTVYHDENHDGRMNRKWYGPPDEGYGFSNNFTSSIRPARFSDASFELNKNKTIDIQIVY